ncbi:hypothetical protein JW960_01070 [candidate division KSB1 bacterium]|nr:hypothetical protein [candidate division KSB1 bacterium]
MVNFHINRLLLTGLMVITVLLLFSCEAKNPGSPSPNQAPDTFISVASPGNVTTISWYGTDKDGFAEVFYYQWDGDADWTRTETLSATFNDVFTSIEDMRTFYVYAEDNIGERDATPASVTLTPSDARPETKITSGPDFGSKTGEDVTFAFSGEDFDAGGAVTSFMYTMDDLSTWITVPVDVNWARFEGLSTGPHTFYVKAVDNLEAADTSPASRTFIVEGATFTPAITNLSPVSDGGGWFAGATLVFRWNADANYYSGQLAVAPYSYSMNDATNFDESPKALASGWNTSTEFAVTPGAGDQTFYLKVRDTAGSISLLKIGISAAQPAFDKGILVVNGVSSGAYGDEIETAWADKMYFGDYDVDIWDLFGTMSTPEVVAIADLKAAGYDYIGGGGPCGPDVLKDYSTVIWLGNDYQGDLDDWLLSPILPYLQAGGNVLLASRLAADFCDDNLTSYLNIGWREGAAAGSAGNGVTLSECKAVYPGLVDMPGAGLSLTNVFSGGGFMEDSSIDDNVTLWDGNTIFQSGSSFLLFAHRSSAYDASYPFSYVRGIGVWAAPNFGTADANKGNFVLIGGRHYRYDHEPFKANMSYIIGNFFGE